VGLARIERTIRHRAGRFTKLFHEYEKGFAKAHYKARSRTTVRWRLLTFLEFLNTRGFSTIRAVRPNTITEFLEWGQSKGLDRPQLRDTLGSVSVFLDWAAMAGRYKGMNPIQPRMHRLVKPERVPRPLTDQALARIWSTLDKRGTLQQKLAVALGEEAGLRISEVCNLRTSDIDMRGHRIFVRVPNKTDSERWAFFHRKTRRLLCEWLSKRDPGCGHDFLFLNTLNQPLNADRLADQLRRVLAGRNSESRDRRQAGTSDYFTFHRLRHTLASRLAGKGLSPTVIMSLLGWKSYRMLMQYVHLHPQKIRELYEEAME
jgi:integrase/recombinase XerD